jgi:predicted ATP-grasp superfamily ATP-dependent carboligase
VAVTRKTVLIGFAEAMAAIEATWSLQGAGFRVAAFARRGAKPALRRVRDVELHEITAPEADAHAAAGDLRRLLEETGAVAYLPLDDYAVWLAGALGDMAIPVAGPSGELVRYALDKTLQLEAARTAGLPVPESEIVQRPEAVAPAAYPAVVKPALALYEVDGRLARPTGAAVADEAELERVREKGWHPPLIVQPLINGTGEGLFGHVTRDGSVAAWSAHRRVRMLNPEGSASSACESIPVDASLTGPAERLLGQIGWRGLFMLEFLRDEEGRPWLMELNGRPWGSMALARRRGFEYPAWAVEGALEESFVPQAPEHPPDVLCRNVALELVHLAFVLRGPQSQSLTRWPKLWPTIRGLLRITRRDRLYNWNRSQPRVLAADTLQTLRQYAGRAAGNRG